MMVTEDEGEKAVPFLLKVDRPFDFNTKKYPLRVLELARTFEENPLETLKNVSGHG